MRRSFLSLFAAACALSSPLVAGPAVGIPSPNQLAQPQTMTTGTGGYSPLVVPRVEHMARVYGDKAAGDGTRYFSVTDKDLTKAKDPAAVLKRLAPTPVQNGDGVRRVDVVVDLQKPLFLHTNADVRIGTVSISPDTSVDVRASIFISDTVITNGQINAK